MLYEVITLRCRRLRRDDRRSAGERRGRAALKLDRLRLRQVLDEYAPSALPLEGMRPAAVLVTLFSKGGRDHLLFTRRTEHLPHHRGVV